MPITDPRISRHILTDEDESDEDEYYKQLRMVEIKIINQL